MILWLGKMSDSVLVRYLLAGLTHEIVEGWSSCCAFAMHLVTDLSIEDIACRNLQVMVMTASSREKWRMTR